MKAIRRFTVRTVLPEQLQPLHELALNLRWSWHSETRDLFRSVDPEIWAATGEDPVRLLGEVPAARLAALAADRRFLRRLGDQADDLREYLSGPRWYQSAEDGAALPAAVAYFSPEYGIAAALPQYSGGLGILAGDHLKSASDLGVPLIGVGLFYRHGYFRQSLSRDGWQQERYPCSTPTNSPSACSARRTAARYGSTSPCPPTAPWPRTSGRPRSGGSRCCCSTPTSRPTRPPSAM